jgi:LPXTG-motif cell wall-anchored protein
MIGATSLPKTGDGNLTPWIVLGLLLVVVGAAATTYARRRRSH